MTTSRTTTHIDSSGEQYPPAQYPDTRAHVDELASKAKLILSANAKLLSQAKTHWDNLKVAIHTKAAATRPKMASYEVYHLTEIARLWFLADIAEGLTPEQAEARGKHSLEHGFQ